MKKYIFRIVTIIGLVLSNLCFSQTSNNEIVIGKSYTITSNSLKDERLVEVYLPESYSTTEAAYPVLYIFDGQMHFENGIAIQKSLQTPGVIPEMIVVGVMNEYPSRRDLGWSNKEVYHSFLEQELIPFVNENFRTNNERVLFGWEQGAFMATYMVLNKKPLFNGVILSNGGNATPEMLTEFVNSNAKETFYMYMVNSIKDIYTIQYSDKFFELIDKSTPSNLEFKYEKLNEETHETLPYLALFHGLKYFYHNYKTLDYSSFKEYEDLGGLPYLKKYFSERGRRFGFSTHIADETKNGLIWLAWNKDNFNYFKFFMTEFKDVLSTKRYDSAYWQNRFGQMYLKHKDLDTAIMYFSNGINTYGDSRELSQMYYGLSKAFAGKKQKRKAINNIKLAIKTAENKSEESLNDYKTYLAELR
ncbi:alpha/beta hydrolase-fold protein [Pontimicrobium sp. SW4]|uniref:Alpha/beta hydrolase-fold protein n=1 Tax=Pontimicrobium sp. SW4 TaxID=3153519 RepID=A0AAU7BT27_9FLAO